MDADKSLIVPILVSLNCHLHSNLASAFVLIIEVHALGVFENTFQIKLKGVCLWLCICLQLQEPILGEYNNTTKDVFDCE